MAPAVSRFSAFLFRIISPFQPAISLFAALIFNFQLSIHNKEGFCHHKHFYEKIALPLQRHPNHRPRLFGGRSCRNRASHAADCHHHACVHTVYRRAFHLHQCRLRHGSYRRGNRHLLVSVRQKRDFAVNPDRRPRLHVDRLTIFLVGTPPHHTARTHGVCPKLKSVGSVRHRQVRQIHFLRHLCGGRHRHTVTCLSLCS